MTNQMTKPIIIFDLHEVMFAYDYGAAFWHIVRAPHKHRLLLTVCTPRFWVNVFKLYAKGAVSQEYVLKMAAWHPRLASNVNTGLAIINAQRPMPGMQQLVTTLAAAGYELHIMSNIGQLSFDALKQAHPALFAPFARFHIALEYNDYLAKPQPAAFEQYKQEHNAANRPMIFIDDKLKNVRAAQLSGMLGIRFISVKKLYAQLARVGISIHAF